MGLNTSSKADYFLSTLLLQNLFTLWKKDENSSCNVSKVLLSSTLSIRHQPTNTHTWIQSHSPSQKIKLASFTSLFLAQSLVATKWSNRFTTRASESMPQRSSALNTTAMSSRASRISSQSLASSYNHQTTTKDNNENDQKHHCKLH